MHRTPLLMIPPLRGAKPPFGGPIKNGVATILGSFPSYSSFGLWRERWKKIPLERGIPAKYHVTPSVFRHPLFYRRAWNAAKRSSLAGKTARAGCLTSYLVLVLFTSRDGSFRSSALFFSPLHFPPLFFPLPEKENVKFGSELRISPVCRFLSFAGKVEGRGGMEFLNLVEVSRDFSFFFFLLGVRGNNVERIWWKIIESDWERGCSLIEWCVKGDGIEVFSPHNRLIKNYEIINYTSNLFDQLLLDRFLLMIRQRNWSINGFLDGKRKENVVGYTEDNLRIEDIFSMTVHRRSLVLKNNGGKKDIINSLIIQAKNK